MRCCFRYGLVGSLLLALVGPVLAQGKDPSSSKTDPNPNPNNEPRPGGRTLKQWQSLLKSEMAKSELLDPGVAENAIRTVMMWGDKARDSGPDLIRGLTHKDTSVRVNSAIAIGFVGLPENSLKKGVTELGRLVHAESQSIVRYQSAMALGRLGTDAKEAIPGLLYAIKDEYCWEIRKAAAFALGAVGTDATKGPDQRAVDALKGALTDKCALVRQEAALSLLIIRPPIDPASKERLKQSLTNAIHYEKDKTVSIWERVALCQLEMPKNKQDPISETFKKNLVVIAKALKTPGELQTRVTAARAMGILAPYAKDHVTDLIEALEDKELMVVGYTIIALGQVGPPANKAIQTLNHFLEHNDESIKYVTREAIEKITGRATKPVAKPQ